MGPSLKETETMPDLERVVIDQLRQDPVGGSELMERLDGNYGGDQVRHAVWRLLDRGQLQLSWQSKLRVVDRTAWPAGIR